MWLIYPMRLYWRKLDFPLQVWSITESFLVQPGSLWPLPPPSSGTLCGSILRILPPSRWAHVSVSFLLGVEDAVEWESSSPPVVTVFLALFLHSSVRGVVWWRCLIPDEMFQNFSVSAPYPVVGLSVNFRQNISYLKLLNCDLYGYMLQYKASLVKYSGFPVSDK